MKFKHDMLTHGVYVVAAQHAGQVMGMAAAWAMQAATSRLVVCMGKQSATRELVLASGAFGLSALRSEQLEIARLFGTQSSRTLDKFKDVKYHTYQTGSPLLDDCGAWFDCRVETVFDLEGDSKLIVGRILGMERVKEEYEPLIYREEDY